MTAGAGESSGASSSLELRAPGVALRAEAWNRVVVLGENGGELVTFSGFGLRWRPNATTAGGRFHAVTNEDGSPAIEVDYEMPADASGRPPRVTGRFTPRPGRVDVRFDVAGLPPGADVGGSMFLRRLPRSAEALPVVKLGLWQRHEHGGLPSEILDGHFLSYRVGDEQILFAYPRRVNADWRDAGSQHAVLRKNDDGSHTAEFSLLLPVAGWPLEALSARWHGRPLALSLRTDRTYNWWSDRAEPLEVKATLVNTSEETRTADLRHRVRDFAGDLVSEGGEAVRLAPGQSREARIRFRSAAERDLFFAEVSAVDRATGGEVFARTNLALLPPHAFKSTPEDSIIGLSAWWPLPNKEEVTRLLRRMGVRWLRHGNTHDFDNITALLHNNIDWKRDYTDAERDAWIRQSFQRCIDEGNPIWEFANEINMSTAGIAQEGAGIGKALLAEKYVDWLRAIRRVQREMGGEALKVKLLSFGIAGMDVKFVERLHELGGWELIDGLALHPGRGNFAPDYPVSEPWEKWTHGMHGSYWNYYGSVRTANRLIGKYGGGKSLWLTEVYSPGWPNSFWEDTPRNGAENVILTQALAMSEGVKATFWYQLFDSVWWDRLGVNPKDREYYFGLINRDLSFKPTMMAFFAAAEALDQARFVRWLQFPGRAHTRGLLFDTPRGPMAVLWDRTDGYVLTKRSEPFLSPEPWIDTWRTRIRMKIPAKGDSLTVVNAIGQRTTVPAAKGSATLILSGAPLIVYGLDADKISPRQ